MAHPRASRLQFSLRLLLLAFTGFAIGFPTWYRWPYEEVEFNRTATASRITTWQRQWGGGRLKHGLQRQVANGETIESLVYRDGLRHGPYESKTLRGQFVNDFKEGVWTGPDRTTTWQRGKLHGLYELRLPPERPRYRNPPPSDEPRTIQLMFAEGRLTHCNGKPASSRLFDWMEDGSMDPRVRNELEKFTQLDAVEMPLQDCVLFLSDVHNISIVVDPYLVTGQTLGPDMPITDEFNGIDLASVLTLMTAPRGLGCDYRYGSLWITAAEDTNDWRDPTGVTEIIPPKDSALSRAWNEPVAVDVVTVPLADVLARLAQPLNIEIDTTQIAGIRLENNSTPGASARTNPMRPSVIYSTRGLPFRHILGQLLYRTGCNCRVEGDKLVILPPLK